MGGQAERGMSAPPEVVFNTAIDPDRAAAWLPEPLREDGSRRPEVISVEQMRAAWYSDSAPDWSAEIQVAQADAGGARVRLHLVGPHNDGLAEEVLASLAREVDDNLTAG